MMCKLNMASCLALMLAAAAAQAQSAAEIMDKADRANRPHDEIARMQMELSDAMLKQRAETGTGLVFP
ncbi:hypothetical protein LP419_38810 [Massilia sp. H-1]|nr:hypothetical protein LP419_38810 [Massilia sp. H-1]